MGRKNHLKNSRQNSRSDFVNKQNELHKLIDSLLKLSTITQNQNFAKTLQLHREIHEVSEAIKTLETQLGYHRNLASVRTDTGTLTAFTRWLRENGANFENVSIEEFSGYELGLKADSELEQNAKIISVPRRLMMTVDDANDSILKQLIEKDALLNNMPNVTLAIFLLTEKYRQDSFWKPYIDVLPANYTTVLYFSIDDLMELQGSPILEGVLKQIRNICRQYAYFHKMIYASDDPACKILKKNFSFQEYCWAVSTVMTRQNTVPSKDGTRLINALIPLWDLCNHTNGTITTDYNPKLDCAECLAIRNFKRGEQIFIFYGPRSNADLFVHNGFVYDDNEHDGYWLRLGISKSDPLGSKRTELLQKISSPENGEFWLKIGLEPVDGQLLAFVRIFNMNEDQLQHWLESDKCGDLLYVDCGLDTELENKSWTFLQARMRLLLASYKTSLEDDVKSAADGGKTKTVAVKMRASEKRILKGVLNYVDQRIKH